MLPRIIAICGAKRSGKDSIARVLQKEYNYDHLQISAKLKAVCQILFGFTDEQLETDVKETIDPRWNVSPRNVMQYLGTEVFQFGIHQGLEGINETVKPREFWIQSALHDANRHPDKNYVITDLRFLHEERILREKYSNIFIIKVIRDSYCDGGAASDKHISEHEYMAIKEDITIYNNSTLDDLHTDVLQRLRELFEL